jgi:dihydroorotate dehydrogenase
MLEPTGEIIDQKLKSIGVFYDNGGDMVTIGNTRPVVTGEDPITKRFARLVAGESGKPLFPYMIRTIRDVHKRYPDLPIIACGGISNSSDAWEAYESGASLVEMYTSLTFHGFGIVREIHEGLRKRLGNQTLQDLVDSHRRI